MWLAWLALMACGDPASEPSEPGTSPITTPPTTAPTPSTPTTPTPTVPRSEPGVLEVGASRVRMPAPVGIGTAGFGPFGVASEPSAFAELYPATQGLHGHPDFQAIALSRGPDHTLVFLRADTVGVFQQLRRAVVLELEARHGRDFDHQLVIGATHTHSGPGRMVDGEGVYDLIADVFLPEHYERMVMAMADAVDAALDDLKPGRVGYAFADGSVAINDRRCEDGLTYVNGDLPVVAIEQEGALRAVMLSYAIHGTVHGIDELLLSQDVSGGVERAVADRLGVPVQMFNSWGGDMSPGHPEVALQEGAVLPSGSERIAAVGQAIADQVEGVMPSLSWTDSPDLWAQTLRTPIDRDAIGYDDDTFPHEYGAVYCTAEGDCDPATIEEGLDDRCLLSFDDEAPAPNQTELTVGGIGDLSFVTFPGEPGTLLAEQIIDDLGAMGLGPVMFVGYGQDYLGYSILEDDWWQGGYEASGSLWGPRQGEYLAAEVVEAMAEALGTGPAAADRPDPVAPFDVGAYAPYAPEAGTGAGTVVTQPPPSVTVTDLVEVVVAGLDPWLGAPVATLETADGQPVLRPTGEAWSSDGPLFRVALAMDPPYDGPLPERAYHWSFSFPAQHPVQGAGPVLDGDYRLSVALPDGTVVTTNSFTVVR